MTRDELVEWALGARPFDDQTWVGRNISVWEIKEAVQRTDRFPHAHFLLALWDAGIDVGFEVLVHRNNDGITARFASWNPECPPGGTGHAPTSYDGCERPTSLSKRL